MAQWSKHLKIDDDIMKTNWFIMMNSGPGKQTPLDGNQSVSNHFSFFNGGSIGYYEKQGSKHLKIILWE